MAIERIFVPTDFSAYSERAVEFALEMARTFGASVKVNKTSYNSLEISFSVIIIFFWYNRQHHSFKQPTVPFYVCEDRQ